MNIISEVCRYRPIYKSVILISVHILKNLRGEDIIYKIDRGAKPT